MLQHLIKSGLVLVLALNVSVSHLSADDEVSVIMKQYHLVGVIATGEAGNADAGIAVIKDAETKRSITVSVGQNLPYSAWKVHKIGRDKIYLQNQGQFQVVTYSMENVDTPQQPMIALDSVREDEIKMEPVKVESMNSNNVISTWRDFHRGRDEGEFDSKATLETDTLMNEEVERRIKPKKLRRFGNAPLAEEDENFEDSHDVEAELAE